MPRPREPLQGLGASADADVRPPVLARQVREGARGVRRADALGDTALHPERWAAQVLRPWRHERTRHDHAAPDQDCAGRDGERPPRCLFFVHSATRQLNRTAPARPSLEQVRQNGFKIETQGKVYYCQAPDEMSLQAWMAALRPLKVGFLMKQGQEVQSWKKRWCMLWRTQLAYFENHADTKDRKGYILLRDTIPGRVFAVDRSVFGHDNIFQVETRERTFFMQAISGDDMQEWLDHINTAVASRGPAEDAMPTDAPADMAMGGGYTPSMVDDAPSMPAEGTPGGNPAVPFYDDGIDEYIPQQEVASASMQMVQANVSQDMASITAMQEELVKRKLELDDREHDLRHREAVQDPELVLDEREQDWLGLAGGGASGESAPKKFVFLVCSPVLQCPQKVCVSATSLDGVVSALGTRLELTQAFHIMTFDPDFEEYVVCEDIDDLPLKAKIQLEPAHVPTGASERQAFEPEPEPGPSELAKCLAEAKATHDAQLAQALAEAKAAHDAQLTQSLAEAKAAYATLAEQATVSGFIQGLSYLSTRTVDLSSARLGTIDPVQLQQIAGHCPDLEALFLPTGMSLDEPTLAVFRRDCPRACLELACEVVKDGFFALRAQYEKHDAELASALETLHLSEGIPPNENATEPAPLTGLCRVLDLTDGIFSRLTDAGFADIPKLCPNATAVFLPIDSKVTSTGRKEFQRQSPGVLCLTLGAEIQRVPLLRILKNVTATQTLDFTGESTSKLTTAGLRE
eukprot:COSAG02_NODE_7773_length_2853_cov_1.289760_1_plen_745_part_10